MVDSFTFEADLEELNKFHNIDSALDEAFIYISTNYRNFTRARRGGKSTRKDILTDRAYKHKLSRLTQIKNMIQEMKSVRYAKEV